MQPFDPAGNYTDAEVIAVLTAQRGTRRMTYRYDRLDEFNRYVGPVDWVIASKLANNALAEIKRTASFTILDRGGINYLKDRIMPWARLDMPGTLGRPPYVEWPLGVFLLATPTRSLDEVGVVQREVAAYDQLLVLRDDKVVDRYSINAGVKYTDAIATLVFGFDAAIVPSDTALATAREWEPGTPKLRILNDLLAAINYGAGWFDERGRLICRPYQSPADQASEYTFEDGQWSVRTGGAEQTLDLFDVHNRWVLIKSEADEAVLRAEYTNDDPSSPTSTVSRGRIIVDFRDNEDAADLAALQARAARYAFEASQVYERMTINTAVMPMMSNADVVTLAVPGLAVNAKYSGHTWEYDMRAGAVMKMTVRRVVAI